ncbi:MAG TPA: biotin--[acetyl-CoA-carboxylase] ligase, partial [Firmicutes bacterium]|nr:biotin--[acetyl-CoA-carboxylase] ligase [Bacillota bacterium]
MSPERKVQFFNYLQEHLTEKISKSVIEHDLGITGEHLTQIVNSLKNYGIKVHESETHIWLEGYPEIFSLSDIVLHTKVVAKKVIPFFDVLSTNDIALRLALQGEPEGSVIIAERQRQGRGKGRTSWFSPADSGLWFSLIFRPSVNTISVEKFTLLSAVSVVESVRELFNLEARLKWPNDVMISGRKFCGILSEG